VSADELKQQIRDIPDFPKKGIVFKDITPLLGHPQLFRKTIDLLAAPYRAKKIDKVIGVEARGFILAPALAKELKAGFVPVRKPGKLPYRTRRISYSLEYGTDTLEIHEDAIRPGERCLLLDDLLATGGTMAACCELTEASGGKIVGCAFLVELAFLQGRKKLKPHPVFSVVQYEKEV
jgi:adenine phosphoribosyltransferase